MSSVFSDFSSTNPTSFSKYFKKLALSRLTTRSIHPPDGTYFKISGSGLEGWEEKRACNSVSSFAETVALIMISSADMENSTFVASKFATSSRNKCNMESIPEEPSS